MAKLTFDFKSFWWANITRFTWKEIYRLHPYTNIETVLSEYIICSVSVACLLKCEETCLIFALFYPS